MKYYGKEKCRILKEIRAEIARANDIEWVVSECKHKGNCKGTCPKCEQEVRQLEDALARREALGKKVAVVGISASIALSVTGCVNPFPETTDGEYVDGGMLPPETSAEETYTAVAGEETPHDDTICDLPTAGVPVEDYTVEMGEIAVEGEFIIEAATTEEETTEADTPEETTEVDTPEETTEPVIEDVMGEPAE